MREVKPERAVEAAAVANISRDTSRPNSRAFGIFLREFDKIAPGAAADLQNLVAGRGTKSRNRFIAAEQIEFAA